MAEDLKHEDFNLFHLSSYKQVQMELKTVTGPTLRNSRVHKIMNNHFVRLLK